MQAQWGMVWLKLPENTKAVWGARAIAQWGYPLDLLYDRQDCRGEEIDRTTLCKWIDKHLKKIRDQKFMGDDRTVFSIDEDKYHFRYTPNGSFGYVYMTAWMEG
jgi:hypothetical protein